MHNLKTAIQEFCRIFWNDRQIARRPFGNDVSENERRQLISRIEQCDDPAMIGGLLPFIASENAELAKAACQVIDRFLETFTTDRYLWLVEHCSDRLDWWENRAWKSIQPSQVPSLSSQPESRTSILGVLTLHPNGFVRQKAVEELHQVRDGKELPFLLLRLNDWVKPIRDRAARFVEPRLCDSYQQHIVDCLPLLAWLLQCRRTEYVDLVPRAVVLLCRSECESQLAEIAASSDRRVRRKITRLALEIEGDHLPRLVRHLIRSNDTALRIWGAERVSRELYGAELDTALDDLRADRCMPVRRHALLALAERSAEDARSVWTETLLDRHRSLRELARCRLAPENVGGFSPFYRENLQTNPENLYALLGLGETGSADDVPRVRTYFRSGRPALRCAAVRAISTLPGELPDPRLTDMISDDFPSVRRATQDALILRPQLVDRERLLSIVLSDNRWQTGQAGLTVFDGLGKWRALPYLIRGCCARCPEVAAHAETLVQRWFSPPRCNRVFTSPSEAEGDAISAALREAAPQLTPAFAGQLLEWMKTVPIDCPPVLVTLAQQVRAPEAVRESRLWKWLKPGAIDATDTDW